MIHLVCGGAGAGKTTYSTALQGELGAIRFSIDEWMVTLFEDDSPSDPDFAWITARLARCDTQIWTVAKDLARRDVASVLDLGFQRAEHRAQFRQKAMATGLGVRLHYLDVAADERWRRVCRRNAEQGETYSLTVTRPMFDFIERLWEPPTTAELRAFNG